MIVVFVKVEFMDVFDIVVLSSFFNEWVFMFFFDFLNEFFNGKEIVGSVVFVNDYLFMFIYIDFFEVYMFIEVSDYF